MKRLIIFLVVIVVAIGVFYYVNLPRVVKPLARLVPTDSCLYFSIRQGGALWGEIEGSRWWKRISEVETLSKMREKVRAVAERQALTLGVDLEQGQLLELLGKEVGMALIPGIRSGGTLLILARVSGSLPRDIMRNLESSGMYRCDSSRYRGARMLLLSSPGGEGPKRGVCRIGDILGLSISDEDPLAALRQVVDLLRSRGEGSLGDSDPYRQVVSMSGEAPECCAVTYFNFSRLEEGDKLLPGGMDIPDDIAQQVGLVKRSLILSLKQMKAGGGMANLEGDLQATLYYIPDVSRMDEVSIELLRMKPKKFKALKLIPSNQMLYSASLCGDARGLWNSFTAQLEQTDTSLAPVVSGVLSDWEAATGISFEKDVLPLVGDEIAYFLSPPGGDQLLPLPGFGVIVKVTDVEKAKSIMDSVMASMVADESEDAEESGAVTEGEKPPSPETEVYKGHTLTFIHTGLIGFSPVYAFLGDFVVATSDSAMMGRIVDVWLGEKESVRASAFYKSLSDDFGDVANSLTFVDMERSLDYLRDLSQIIGSLMSLADGGGGDRTDFAPFLECMRVVKYIYGKTETSEEVVKQVIFVKVEDLKI